MSKNQKSNNLPDCECGCGASTKGGRFLPGHDAKLKRALVEAALGGSKRAAAKLEALGWTKFLDAKRDRASEQSAKAKPRPTAKRGRRRKATEQPASEASEVTTQPEEPQS